MVYREFKDLDIFGKLWRIIEVTFLTLSLVLALTAFILSCYQKLNSGGVYRTEYQGIILTKTIKYYESIEGTFTADFLLIKEEDGNQFWVKVSDGVYNHAQTGMWIQRNKNGVELYPSVISQKQ